MAANKDPEDDKDKPWVVAVANQDREEIVEDWKVPIWQRPIDPTTLALHPDGPLNTQKREGYLQKRAGTSRLRWNIRYFELADGHLRWWRPQFIEMLKMPRFPKVAKTEPRPRPIRDLDLSRLKSVTRTRVRFPYSTRILLSFHEDYTKYQLELRAERENIIVEWFRICSRFAMETHEAVIEKGEDEKEVAPSSPTATPCSQSEREEGFEDVAVRDDGAPQAPGNDGYPASAGRPAASSGGYAAG